MKIAIELQPCLKNKSGIGIYTYELSKRLQQYHDIELKGDIFNFLERNDLTKDLEGLAFEKAICKVFPYGVYRRIWHYIPVSYQCFFKREADITHFFNFIVPPKIKGKVVNTIHDLTFELYPETMDKRNLKRIKQDIAYSIGRSDCIVTISESSKADIINLLKVDPDIIHIIYPGVNYPLFSQKIHSKTKEQIKAKYHLPSEYILYMGTLEPRKNISTIVEAFAKLKDEADSKVKNIKLVLAGKKGWLFQEIFARIQKLKLEEEIIFTDYIAEEDKPVIYQLAKAFVFPSLYEGFGIPVLEAMAASVPVITSNTSSLPEAAGNAAVLINPKDIEALAEGIYKLLTDETYRQEIIDKGHSQAKKFDWDESAYKLKELYNSIL